MLSLQGVTKKFRRKMVLEQLDYTFHPGIYGLLGPNGAGKTTLMRCIAGLYRIDDGDIQFRGQSIKNNTEYLSHFGYLPQQFGLFKDLKVMDMMLLLANVKGVDSAIAESMVTRCVEMVNLSERLHHRVATLSGGMVRRLGIAQALLNEPDVIVFDEPTAGLDPEERLRFKNLIGDLRKDKIVIISTHIVEDVEAVCDTIAIMNGKHIAREGTTAEIASLAQGKVYIVPEREKAAIQGNYVLQKQSEANGLRQLTILSNHPQSFPAASPSIEDGYICELKGI
jgi:ABC-2 type transport system ATP-binding protein